MIPSRKRFTDLSIKAGPALVLPINLQFVFTPNEIGGASVIPSPPGPKNGSTMPSKKRGKKKRKPSSQIAAADGGAGGGGASPPEETQREDEESIALNWLTDAFASASLDQITSAYREAGGDPYKAAGILGAELVDPGEGPVVERSRGAGNRRTKRVAAATGMVSNVIGKGYSKPAVAWRRICDGLVEAKGRENQQYSAEEAEEFLCSMLGDNAELGMGVVRDVLGQCGYDVEKALDSLLDISASSYIHFREKGCGDSVKVGMNYSGTCPEIFSNNPPRNILSSFQLTDKASDSTYHLFQKEHENLPCEGYGCRENMKDLSDSMGQPLSKPKIVKSDLQQKVLETLFSLRDYPKYEPKCMDWKKVVKKVESFGQGLEFSLASIAEPHQTGKGDGYTEFRSVARKHWNEMRNFYQKAAIAYSRGERAHAAYLSEKGKSYSRLAREADEKASRDIFEARNKDIKNTVTIDLHGQHVKQAIGLLKLHLLLFTYIPSVHFLKVITGSGADGVGKGRLKRSVIDLVGKEGIEWSEENSGTLILRLEGLKEYSFMECDSDSE